MNLIWKLSEASIKKCAQLIREGGICAIGTETVYGLTASYENISAIKKIFACKRRPLSNPLIVHCKPSWYELDTLVSKGLVSEKLDPQWVKVYNKVTRHFSEGPLTFLMPKGPKVSDIITAGSPFVAIRRPHQCAMQQLLETLEVPLVAPSANIYQQLSPTSAQMVDTQFETRTFPIIDSGPCREGIESTVISIQGDAVTIHRSGPISVQDIEACGVKVNPQISSHSSSPGQATKHYSPRTPISLVKSLDDFKNYDPIEKTGFLLFADRPSTLPNAVNLGTDAREAARELYETLFRLDQMGLKAIIATLPQGNSFQAIRDKLVRAAST